MSLTTWPDQRPSGRRNSGNGKLREGPGCSGASSSCSRSSSPSRLAGSSGSTTSALSTRRRSCPRLRAFWSRRKKRAPAPVRARQPPSLLEEERYAKRLESIAERAEELDTRESGLDKRDADISQKAQELDDRRQALDDKEKSFNDKVKQYDNRKANIDQNAQYLVGMPPAIRRWAYWTRWTTRRSSTSSTPWKSGRRPPGSRSLVSVWLSGMPPDRSATLQRKMAAKPSSLE